MLTGKTFGLHFNAVNAKSKQITDFASGELVTRISKSAPHLWGLMQSLLSSDGIDDSRKDKERHKRVSDLVRSPSNYLAALSDLSFNIFIRKLVFTSEVYFLQTTSTVISYQQ